MSWHLLSRRFAALRKPDRDLPPMMEWFRGAIPPSWEFAPHMRFMVSQLKDVEDGVLDRLAIHCPPRHGKTETATVRGALRALERRPWENVLVTAYGDRHARRISRKIRTLARERGLVGREKAAEDEWQTDEGGTLMARGVGSPPTGVGFHRIFIDDPIRRRQDADSPVYRERAWDWYSDDLMQRLEPGGAIIMTATLWHHDDICSRAVASEKGRWRVCKLPALAEEGDLMGRQPGEALWPSGKWTVDELMRRRAVMVRREGERNWNSVYQQNPTPSEGSFFKVHRFDYQHVAPFGLPRVRAWDLAYSKRKGDGTASVLMAGPDAFGIVYVLDVTWEQLGIEERDAFIRKTVHTDGHTVKQIFPDDPGGGKFQVEAIIRMLAGYPVSAKKPDQNKEIRAAPFASYVNAGNVVLIIGEWNTLFTESLRMFPLGAHDDIEDAGGDAFNSLPTLGGFDVAVGGPKR